MAVDRVPPASSSVCLVQVDHTVRRAPGRVGPASWLVLLAVIQTVGVAVLYRFFVLTPTGQRLEAAALAGNVIGQYLLDEPVSMVLDLVSVAAIAAATVAIGFIALARRRFVLAVVAVLIVAGANITTQVLKRGLLSRPDFGYDEHSPDIPSLPSGHSTVAMSVAIALVLVLPPRLRGSVALFGAGYAGLTGVATLSAGWHRPSDVLAAYLVVGAWTAVGGLVLLGSQTGRALPTPEDSHPVAVALLGLGGGLLLVVGGWALLSADRDIATPVSALSRMQLFVSYAGGAAAIVGTAALVTALLMVSLHRVVPRYLPR